MLVTFSTVMAATLSVLNFRDEWPWEKACENSDRSEQRLQEVCRLCPQKGGPDGPDGASGHGRDEKQKIACSASLKHRKMLQRPKTRLLECRAHVGCRVLG